MSHKPSKYFVVVLLNEVPQTVRGANGKRIVSEGETIEQVVNSNYKNGPARPLRGWRTMAGARKWRDLEPCDAEDRAAGWAVRLYHRVNSKLEPVFGETRSSP